MLGFISILLFYGFIFFFSYFIISKIILKKKESESRNDAPEIYQESIWQKLYRSARQLFQKHETNSSKIRYCPYCDSKVPKNAHKCWNCKNKIPVKPGRLVLSAVVSFIGVFIFLLCVSSITLDSTEHAPTMSKSEYIDKCETISYEKLARNPDSYKGDYFEFTGEVIQVIQSGRHVELRVNVTREDLYGTTMYSDTIYVETKLQEDGDRILEGDIITLYGVCDGLYTYTTIFGATMSIPKIDAAYWNV